MSGYTATCILNLGTRYGWSASSPTDMKLYSRGQSLVSTEQEAVGPQSWSGHHGEEKNLCLRPAIKRFLIHQSKSLLTNVYTIPDPSVHREIKNTSFHKMHSTNDKRVHQFLIFSLRAKTMLQLQYQSQNPMTSWHATTEYTVQSCCSVLWL